MVLTKIPGGLIADSSITSADIQDSTITNAKMAVDPSNASNLSSGDVPLAQLGNVPDPDLSSQSDDIALLAFKTQANGNLARYNLVDQSVDSFEDASGVDASASTGETRDGTGKYYSGSSSSESSTGFTVTGGLQTFTVPAGVTSVEIKCWGASGSTQNGGFSTGNLSTSGGTQYAVVVGEQTADPNSNTYSNTPYGGGGRGYNITSAGGLSGVFTGTGAITFTSTTDQARAIIIAGGGGSRGGFGNAMAGVGGGAGNPSSATFSHPAANINTTDSAYENQSFKTGIGGTQSSAGSYSGMNSGSVMKGGDAQTGNEDPGGGGGYYGGAGGHHATSGGGGSGYVGTQNGLSSGATYYAWDGSPSGTMTKKSDVDFPGDDVAKVLFKYTVAAYNDMTLVSNSITAEAEPTKADVVLTYTNGAGTATINVDLIASVSRDNGTTYTPVTLASQGTTGGHTILTANDVSISGQPAGTSMRWKVVTANQSISKQTRVHAVSLGWS